MMNKNRRMVENIDDVRSLIVSHEWKIFGIGGLPITRTEIYSLVSDFELICSTETSELKSIRNRCKVSVFDLEKRPESRKPGDILADERVVEYIKKSSEDKKIAIYVMKPSNEIEEACRENHWRCICGTEDIYKKLDDRLLFYEVLEEIGFGKSFKVLNLRELELSMASLFEEFGDKIVIQSLLGAGGRGTVFIEKGKEFEGLKEIAERLWYLGGDDQSDLVVTSFVKGVDVGAMGCVTKKNGILSAYPRYQMIDIKESIEAKDDGTGIFCGHDWSLSNNMSDDICRQAKEFVEKIGESLQKRGHSGIFGVDFMFNQEAQKLIPIETNPRLLGSFPVAVQVQKQKKEVPLVAFHILEFLGIEYDIKNEEVYRKDQQREGAHLILFNQWGRNVEFKKSLKGGVYCIEGGRLNFLRDGFEIEDIKDVQKEFVLIDGVPIKGRSYMKNRKILRFIFNRQIADSSVKKLLPEISEFVEITKNHLDQLI